MGIIVHTTLDFDEDDVWKIRLFEALWMDLLPREKFRWIWAPGSGYPEELRRNPKLRLDSNQITRLSMP
eukprot:2471189-Prorocentrum_lima.AAC.1